MGAEQQLRDELEGDQGGRSAVVGGYVFPDGLTDDLDANVENLGMALVALHAALLRVGRQIDYLSQRMSELEKTADWIEGKVRRM